MSQIDVDKDGDIEYSEFLVAASNKVLSETKLRAAFEMFDKNRDGVITYDEI